MAEKKVMFVPLEKALSDKKTEQEEEVVPPTEKVEEDTAAPEVDKPVQKKTGKYTILVAEDEKPLSRALELKLTNQGFNVLTAFDGEEAFDMLKSNKVDLAILDIVMPKLDGFGVLAKVKEAKMKVHTVVISNLSQDEDKAKAIALGASEYFIKSDIPISDIVSYITKTLNA